MKNVKCVMVVVLMLAMAGSVCAEHDWAGPTGNWTNNSWGWTPPNAPPLSSESANIYAGVGNYPIISTAVSLQELYIGGYVNNPSADGRVDMIGGSLNTVSAMVLGVNNNRYGEFNQSAGTTTLSGHLYIALAAGTSGKVNLSGTAALSCNTLAMGNGTTPLSAILNISDNASLSLLAPWLNRDGTSLITLSGHGKLILAGDKPNFASDNVYYGGLRAGPGQIIVSSYDVMNDNTTIKAFAQEEATRPYPVDHAINVDPNYILTWEPGFANIAQNVFFGTDYSVISNSQILYGDFDGDGNVDLNDLSFFAQQWLTLSPVNGIASADLNDDGTVNYSDYNFLGNTWGIAGDGTYKGHYKLNKQSFDPGTLQKGTTYYWRVDQVQQNNIVKGDTWNFATLSHPMIPNEIIMHNGAPAFSINGQPEVPMLHFQTVQTTYDPANFRNAGFTLFSFVGNWNKFGMDIGWSGGNVYDDSSYNYNQVDTAMEAFTRQVPDGVCIPRLLISAAEWWIDAHPAEAVGFADGTGWISNDWGGTKHESFASQLWLTEYGEALRRFVRHVLDSPYADRVLGIHIASGVYGEWHGWSPTNYPDTSEPMRQALIQYLQGKYGDDVQLLRNAWGDQAVTFATVSIPTLAERKKSGDVGMFRNPAISRKLMDYYECYHRVTVKAIDHFASIIKQESNGKLLTMALYNYIPDISWPQEGDHRAAAPAMRTTNIDIFASPHTYGRRNLGQDGMFRNFPASIALHNKLFLDEGDDRTYLAPTGWPAVYATNLDESLQLTRREFSNIVTNSAGMYYMDQSATFFNDSYIMADMANIKHWADYSMNLPRGSVNDVAIISSMESEFYSTDRVSGQNNVSSDLYEGQIKELCQTGAPFDWYLIEDLEEGLIPPHKVYVFLDAFYLTASQRTAIEGLKSGNRTLVWFYAPGFVSTNQLSLINMELLTGITFTQISPRNLRVNLDSVIFPGVSSFGTSSTQSPAFMPAATGAEIWGRYNGTSNPALIAKSFSAWRSIYCPGASLPAAVLRKIFSDAGVHIYLSSGDNVCANQSWIGIHTASAGLKTIKLPKSSPVYDVINNTLISSGTTQFQVQLDAKKTAIYMLSLPE